MGMSVTGCWREWIESAKPSLSPRHLAAIREFRYAYEQGFHEDVA